MTKRIPVMEDQAGVRRLRLWVRFPSKRKHRRSFSSGSWRPTRYRFSSLGPDHLFIDAVSLMRTFLLSRAGRTSVGTLTPHQYDWPHRLLERHARDDGYGDRI